MLLCRLTIQDQLVLCQYGEGLQRARMWAWQWSHCQASVTSPPDAMTTAVAADCLINVACRDASPLPVCRTAMWKTHWGSSQRTLWCPGKRQIWEWLNPKWNNNVGHASAAVLASLQFLPLTRSHFPSTSFSGLIYLVSVCHAWPELTAPLKLQRLLFCTNWCANHKALINADSFCYLVSSSQFLKLGGI